MSSIDLRSLRIASPCTEKWSEMSGDERLRHCAKCRLNVYNFAELPVADIETLLKKSEGRVCARLYRRADGTVITRDCPVGLRRVRIRLAVALTAVVALVLGVGGRVVLGRGSTDGGAPESLLHTVDGIDLKIRRVPIIGALVEWLDPSPLMVMGEIAGPPTPPPYRAP